MAKYLITGHTGFKGSWMTLLLKEMGHEVYGYSLPPKESSLFALCENDFKRILSGHQIGNLTDFDLLQSTISSFGPDKIVHLAAQSLVIKSYEDPLNNIESNLIGTKNLLDAVRLTNPKIPMLVATTDKVYKNDGRVSGYTELDELLGGDPYSLSKSLADITTQYYINYLGLANTHIVRAGNVIGGGDVSENRLLPELINHALADKAFHLRNPESTRPWQYVLDCIYAYVMVLESPRELTTERVWNIGPRTSNSVSVRKIAQLVQEEIGAFLHSTSSSVNSLEWKESQLLSLDSSKFREVFEWYDKYPLDVAVRSTVNWYRNVNYGENPYTVSNNQIREFLSVL